ncbi:MAG: MucB/RseB C-terminal domain-containing protein [Pseudomonadales bacterium]
MSRSARHGNGWRRHLAALLLAGACPLAAHAAESTASSGDSPRAWLQDMSRAFGELSYDGVFSYYGGQDLATLRVVHMVVDGEPRERLVHLNGAPREIVRTGDQVVCIVMPGDALLELEDSIPAGPLASAFIRGYDRISENYALSFFGEDRVAGRTAMRLAVTPKDQNRFGYRLWLDKDTRLLLRSELIDGGGDRLEIFQFTDLRLGDDVDPAALEPEGPDGSLVTHLTLATQDRQPVSAAQLGWRLGWLPDGFSMASADIRSAPRTLKSVRTMMYTDGLAAFSVFIESMPERAATAMVSRSGATVAVTHVVQGADQQPHLVTLVGELPTATAQRIARSVVIRSEGDTEPTVAGAPAAGGAP